MEMKLSNNGIDLIKSFEGFRTKAYKCLSTEKYYTIGYGHYGADVTSDMVITEQEAEQLLKRDCERFVNHVNSYNGIYNFNQNEFDALVSFAYNVGNIKGLTNKGSIKKTEIPSKMQKYCYGGGIKLPGLVRRREKEIELFNTPVTNICKNLKNNNTIALEVIQGKWGNGASRRLRLTESGYNYKIIQSIVNEMLRV